METLKRQHLSERERFVRRLRRVPVLTPPEINQRLEDLGYRGQAEPRRAVSLMAYRHHRRIRRIYLEGAERREVLPKANYLFIGPTGCGKTFIVELLFQEILRLPTVVVDVTSYSETGYVGQDTNSILTRLLHGADNDMLWASVGVVCLDEFDKLASGRNNAVFAGAGTTKDVTGLGVQRELLKLLEATDVVVPLELGHSSYGEHVIMNTADVSFIACGAFSGFHEVLRQAGMDGAIGFGRTQGPGRDPDQVFRTYTQQEVENIANFYRYGFLPELMARFTRIVPFEALSHKTLKEILEIDVVRRMEQEFQNEGLELLVDDEVLDFVVAESHKLQTGARGLGALLTRYLEGAAFESFGQGRSGPVVVKMKDGRVEVERP